MKCVSEFIYKSLEKRDGGKFTNEKGDVIEYNNSYVLKVDESTSKGIYERKFKFPVSNVQLVNKIKEIEKLYTKILIEFDVELYGSQARVTPTDISVAQ